MKKLAVLMLAMLSGVVSADERGSARAQLEPNGFLYGVGLSLSKEIYQGFGNRVIPLPIIGYRSENLTVYGPFVSYEFAEIGDIEFEARLSPRFQGFDDSDSDVFAGMEERDSSIDAGLAVKYERDDWRVNVSGLFDVLNKSDGYEVRAQVGRAFQYGPVFFEPNVSVSYLDESFVDYYYGVRADEVTAERVVYNGDSAVNTSLGLSVSTPIFFGGFTQFAVDYTWYDDAITDSPLVDDDANFSVRLLFSKFF